MRLPDPSIHFTKTRSAFQRLRFSRVDENNGALQATGLMNTTLDVDSEDSFSFSVYSPFENFTSLHLYDPEGKEVDLISAGSKSDLTLGDNGDAIPGTVYTFDQPMIGAWTLLGSIDWHHIEASDSGLPYHFAVNLFNNESYCTRSHLSSYKTHVGGQIGLVASMHDQRGKMLTQKGVVHSGQVTVILPDKKHISVPMHDDGKHGDEDANDGKWGGYFIGPDSGTYMAQTLLLGKHDGKNIQRTAQHLIRVVNDDVNLTRVAEMVSGARDYQEEVVIRVFLEKNSPIPASDSNFRGYAEVYGTNLYGELVPACWISSILAFTDAKQPYTEFYLNIKWLTLQSLTEPILLKNVYIQKELVPIEEIDEILVRTNGLVKEIVRINPHFRVQSIEPQMRTGRMPAELVKRKNDMKNTILPSNPKLLVSHGYCALANPFKITGYESQQNFTNAIFLMDLEASRSNMEFAQVMINFTTENNITSYGVVAHSQGGLAALTLHNYFHSGLELANGPRLIQTVGSPYGGSSLSGIMADIGELFGLGCGPQFDISHDGAALWLSGITMDTRADDYYYATQYEPGHVLNFCNLGTNLFLDWPNDGLSEVDYTSLEGGNALGIAFGECHTIDMAWAPQCTNGTRNSQMNLLAAR